MPTSVLPKPNLLPGNSLPTSLLRGRERGRASRLYPDLNISKVARVIKCEQSHLSNILHGKRNGAQPLMEKIAGALGISLDELSRVRHQAFDLCKKARRKRK